jgi:phage-related protein
MAADFTYLPDSVLDEEPEFNTLITKFENGAEQRRSKRSLPIRKWKLIFRNRTQSEFEDIRDFFIDQQGAYASFTWENPNDSTEYTVRFEKDSIKFQRKTFNAYDFELGFIEVI